MVIKTVCGLSYYEYGTVYITGIPEQPKSITLFSKIKEQDGVHFRTQPLIPLVFLKQRGPGAELVQGFHFFSQLSRTPNLSAKIVAENIYRIVGLCSPLVNIIQNIFIESHDHSNKILESIEANDDVAGVAIEGVVISTFDANMLDNLTEDTTNLDNDQRLELFHKHVLYLLKSSGEILKKLLPAEEILKEALDLFITRIKANERDIKEIGNRIYKIEKRKHPLTRKQTLELQELNMQITQIIKQQIASFKSESAVDPRTEFKASTASSA